jgi:hypothetical protein
MRLLFNDPIGRKIAMRWLITFAALALSFVLATFGPWWLGLIGLGALGLLPWAWLKGRADVRTLERQEHYREQAALLKIENRLRNLRDINPVEYAKSLREVRQMAEAEQHEALKAMLKKSFPEEG